jgi:hypothetical protein
MGFDKMPCSACRRGNPHHTPLSLRSGREGAADVREDVRAQAKPPVYDVAEIDTPQLDTYMSLSKP